jgi:Kef-type K+ transport system membrane component KefB
VLGELLAGVLLGGSLLGLVDPSDAVLHALSEIGVLVLLFEIGLHTDVRSLARVGGAAGRRSRWPACCCRAPSATGRPSR